VSCAKTGAPILTIYMSYAMFVHKELPFRNCDDCAHVKNFSGVNVFNRD